jgi:hypothetical protein
MKKFLLFGLFFSLGFALSAQVLYNNSTNSGYLFNPGFNGNGVPKVAFDDVNIASTSVSGRDSFNVTLVKIAIYQPATASNSTTVKVYYTPYDDTATMYNTLMKIPPVLFGTATLAPTTVAKTTILSFGDSVNTLFKIKVDTGAVYTGYQTFFIGTSLSTPNTQSSIRLANASTANDDVMWIYNADSTVPRYATYFGGTPRATFNIQVFGKAGANLPVTLVSFKGERVNKANILSWTTANEVNNAGFELERSADGTTFSKIATVGSKATNGNSAAALTYQFDDVTPLTSGSYYRLKQLDKDGKFTYSKTVLIKAAKVSAVQIATVYPNPAASSLGVIVTAPQTEKVTLLVTDLSGKTLIRDSKTLVEGDNRYTLDVTRLAAGSYILTVTTENAGASTVKFVKQ